MSDPSSSRTITTWTPSAGCNLALLCVGASSMRQLIRGALDKVHLTEGLDVYCRYIALTCNFDDLEFVNMHRKSTLSDFRVASKGDQERWIRSIMRLFRVCEIDHALEKAQDPRAPQWRAYFPKFSDQDPSFRDFVAAYDRQYHPQLSTYLKFRPLGDDLCELIDFYRSWVSRRGDTFHVRFPAAFVRKVQEKAVDALVNSEASSAVESEVHEFIIPEWRKKLREEIRFDDLPRERKKMCKAIFEEFDYGFLDTLAFRPYERNEAEDFEGRWKEYKAVVDIIHRSMGYFERLYKKRMKDKKGEMTGIGRCGRLEEYKQFRRRAHWRGVAEMKRRGRW